MIGNDIVDLQARESQPEQLHPRFDQRVFCQAELQLLRESDTPHELRWSLWAAKEAAFKALQRERSVFHFKPRHMQLQLDDATLPARAWMHCDGQSLEVRFLRSSRQVHAIVSSDEPLSGHARLRRGRHSTAEQRHQVRKLVCWHAAQHLAVKPSMLRVRQQGRIPQLINMTTGVCYDLSISHHGHCLAWAMNQLSLAK